MQNGCSPPPPRPRHPDSSTCLTSSLVALDSFLNFLPPPPHLRHFHLCSLGSSQEYEMATRKWGCIRSPWFFESHLKFSNPGAAVPTALAALKSEQRQLNAFTKKCVPLHWILRCYLYSHLHKAALLKGQPYYFQWNQAPSDLKALAHDLESMLPNFCLISHLSSFLNNSHPNPGCIKFFQRDRSPSLCIRQCPTLKKNMPINTNSNLENKVIISRQSEGFSASWALTVEFLYKLKVLLNSSVYLWLLKAKTSGTTVK